MVVVIDSKWWWCAVRVVAAMVEGFFFFFLLWDLILGWVLTMVVEVGFDGCTGGDFVGFIMVVVMGSRWCNVLWGWWLL